MLAGYRPPVCRLPQVVGPVQWETTMKTLLERGLEQSYEIGPNKVIAGESTPIATALPSRSAGRTGCATQSPGMPRPWVIASVLTA